MRKSLSVLVGCVLSCAMTAPLAAAEAGSSIGQQAPDFSLGDYRGKTHQLADYQDAKLVVLAFLGVDCPLAKLYAPRLAELAAEFGPQGVVFLGINSNRQDSITRIAAYARIHGVEFPILKDNSNLLADELAAERTPEVFVLDGERVVRYRGRIDDQYGIDPIGRSYQRSAPTRRDLAEALTALLAGEPAEPAATAVSGCLIGRIREPDPTAEVTYSNQIARVLQHRCEECHREGQIAPFPLTTYDETVGWADMIAEVVREQRMPPWHADPKYGHFVNDARLSDEELRWIAEWVAAGAPEGDPADLPEPREYPEGWQLPREPDAIVYMSDEPYEVQAEGTVAYQYFVVDPGFTEDKWVRVAECIPGAPEVVHHIIAFIRPPGQPTDQRGRDPRGFHFLAGFAPGTRPFEYPEGMAKLIPAGSQIVFQMHYTPNGSVTHDRSAIGLVFMDAADVKYRVATTNAINGLFRIPPGDDNHRVTATRRIQQDSLLLSLFPHMHVRGKSFRYELVREDGASEILLDVPRYDFGWQNHYIFHEPLELAPGMKIHCTAHFDNSAENLANPDPTAAVTWGDQTWEEMMIGWFDVAYAVDAEPAADDSAADDSAAEGSSGGE